MRRFDAILIPGGGLLAGGELPRWTVSRLELALARWSDRKGFNDVQKARI